jgi:CelD/BcsL family acetyltransferase involved in cellulose biosynthesis
MVVKRLESVAELRRAAPAWNDLWRRSEVARPTARAEMIAGWCESFAAGRTAGAVVVEDGGQLVAALPILVGRLLGLRVARLPGNEWSPAGELLLDGGADTEPACRALADGLRQSRPGWMWLDAVPLDAKCWQSFFRVLEAGRYPYDTRRQFTAPTVDLAADWPTYLASRSRNHRQHVRKIARRAEKAGLLELARHERLSPDEVEPVLRACFELEAGGWKGRQRTAVLCVPKAWNFYLRQARQLAACGELRVAILHFDRRPIAFEYGWEAKGVRAVLKVGFDEASGRFSPGQLLRYLLLEELFGDPTLRMLDYMGPSTDATAHWATDAYARGRVVCSFSSLAGRAAIAGLRYGGPLVRKIRRRAASEPLARPCGVDADAAAEVSAGAAQ